MPKKKPQQEENSSDSLKGFEIGIDSFGNIQTNMDIARIREFLDERIDDRRLEHLREEEE